MNAAHAALTHKTPLEAESSEEQLAMSIYNDTRCPYVSELAREIDDVRTKMEKGDQHQVAYGQVKLQLERIVRRHWSGGKCAVCELEDSQAALKGAA